MLKTGADEPVGGRTKSALKSLDSTSDGPNKRNKTTKQTTTTTKINKGERDRKKRGEKKRKGKKKRKKERKLHFIHSFIEQLFENLLCTRHRFRFQENISNPNRQPSLHVFLGLTNYRGKTGSKHNQ